jgi:hypothetical protein
LGRVSEVIDREGRPRFCAWTLAQKLLSLAQSRFDMVTVKLDEHIMAAN